MIDETNPQAASPPPTANDTADQPTSGEARDAYEGLLEPRGFLEVRPTWVAYASAVAITLTVVGLRRWLDLFVDNVVPFVLFFPVVLVCALFGGVGPGLVSLAISAIAASVFWLDLQGQGVSAGTSLVNLLLFVFGNCITILVAHFLRSAYNRLRESEARLTLAQNVGRIGIWDLNLKTGALWWSPSFHTVTGISTTEAPSIEGVMRRIDPADRDRAFAVFDEARRGLNRLDIDFRFHRDDGTMIWLAGRAELFRDAKGKPSRMLGINFDATPIRSVQSERDEANSLLRTFFDTFPGAAYVKDREGRYLFGNPGLAAAIGHQPESFLGRSDREVLLDKEQAGAIMGHDREVMHEGRSFQLEEDLILPDGRLSHWLSVKTPFRDADGQLKGILGISLDVTERRKAEERLRFLADEVDHRARNLLGVVLSVVRLTKVDDVSTFKAAVSGRIEALARAHTLLAANRWEGVDIATLVHEELAAFKRTGAWADSIHVHGPSLILEPNASQALAMVVHELAMNAAVYGALSVETGQLTMTWQLIRREAESFVQLDWKEAGGPAVSPPEEPGFGSTAIRGAIEHQLGGEFDLAWNPTGVTCRVVFPTDGNTAQARSLDPVQLASPETTRSEGGEVSLAGKRVLILEDEALIAMTLMDTVRDLGCEVIGPAASNAAALELIQQQWPELAILDVNLSGMTSASVARALKSADIPFVYCTGYAEPAQQIDSELRAQVLTKPIDSHDLAEALRNAIARSASDRDPA